MCTGNAAITGGPWNDTLAGGPGNETFSTGAGGNDTFDEGGSVNGSDTSRRRRGHGRHQ